MSYIYDCGNGKQERFTMLTKHLAELVPGKQPTVAEDGWKDYWRCKLHKNEFFEDETCETRIANLDEWKTGKGKLEKLTPVATIDEETFPDEKFRNFLLALPEGNDGFFTQAEIDSITKIDCSNQSISDLTGIHTFTALTELVCYENQISKLDLSRNSALEKLNCSNNLLTELDVSANSNLQDLQCNANQLLYLDLGSNGSLNNLSCDDNKRMIVNGTAISELNGFQGDNATVQSGGNFDGGKVNFTAHELIYKYDCGNGNTATFTMMSEHQTQLVEGKAATCEEAGQKSHYKCSICGKLFTGADAATETTEDALIIPPTGHQWGEPVIVFAEDGKNATASVTCQTDKNHVKDLSSSVSVTSEVGTPATCEGKGTTLYTAKVIFEGESYTATKEVEDIEAIGHSWGATTYTATVVFGDKTYTDTTTRQDLPIDPENHNNRLVEVEAKEPTCTEDGNHAHWRCDGCNKLFSDAEGKNEISVDEVTIDALGHTAEKVAGQAPTYTSAGWKDYWKCSVCQKLFEEESCTTEITDLESWKTGKGRLDQLTRPQKPDSGEDDKDEKPSERPESSEETESIVKPNTSNKPDSSVKPEQPNGNNNAAVTVKPTITEDTAKVELSKETIDRTIAKAEKKSKENISVEVESKTGNSNNLSFDLPKATVEALVKKNVQELKLNTDSVDITLSRELLKEIQNQMATDVRLTIQKIDNSKLDAQAKSIIGNRPVYTFSIVGSNGKQLTDFGKGRVSIFLPYTINAGENPAALLAYQIDQSGKAIQLSNSAYLSERQAVGLVADTVSCFAVGYKNVPAFTDTANHWAKSSIEYVVASGLLSETGNRTFSPDAPMTAEVFAAALGKLAGAKAGTDSSYLEWVNNLGIMNGLGEGKLQTQQKMTREQIAVALYNYAKYIGFELPKSYEENIFTDANQVQENAKQAVKAMQMAGILAGKDGNRFDPKTNVTRAEMAVILERFVKVLIVGGSSEGWMCNDSGKWMYYENGKAVTGKKKIDGKTYTFNNEGVVAEETKSKESASKPVSKVNTSGKLSIKNILLNLFSSRK